MEETIKPSVIGVRFSKIGKIYHFSADEVADVKVGDMVVVETTRGWQLGQVAQVLENASPPPEGWKPVDRRATPRDLLLRQMWQMKEAEVVSSCKERATTLNLSGIKIVSAEYSFDGSRLTILFNSETEEKYDLKSLRSDMQKMFAPSQVEMRQIGPRDVAKTHCGMGACGLETRCCCLFLTEFSSISIRMAKEQGISLTPTEITGMCGRLRCCLIYEYDTYVDARAKLPKRNKRVRTPQGEGKVVDVVPLREAVIVELPEVGRREFPGSEVSLVEDGGGGPQPQQQPFKGTQQPSEIDQAITGDETPRDFVISEDASFVPTDRPGPGEGPSQRPPYPPRERGGEGERQPRGDRRQQPQGGGPAGRGRPAGEGPGRGPRREGRRRPEGGEGRPPEGVNRPEGGRQEGGRQEGGTGPEQEGQRPGQGARPDRKRPPRQGRRPDRPRGEAGQPGGGPQSGGPQGSGPQGSGPQGGEPQGGQPGGGPKAEGPRGNRDSRRRRGRQRDSNDGENRT